MGVDIGPKIGIDGEAEFRKALQEIATQAKTLGAEMKAVTSAFDKNDKSQAALSAKAGVLAKQIQAQKDKLELQKKALEESRQKFGDADAATQKWQKIVYESTATLNKMERELAETEDGMKDTADAAEDAGESTDEMSSAMDNAGKSASSLRDIIKGNLVADAIKGLASAFSNAAAETREYRKIIGSLEVSSKKAGYTAGETAETYRTLYGVLADDQTAATTTANLQTLGLEQSELNDLVTATIGAWATYGDSIPIDGLAEAINETIKTGAVTGTFADVLNWAGTSEDEFNEKLATAKSEAERTQIVMDELANQGLVDAGNAWQENNRSLVEANRATASQQEAIAQLGAKAEPVLTAVTSGFTDVLAVCNDIVSEVDFSGIADEISSCFSYLVETVAPEVKSFVNFVLENKEAVISAIAGIGAGFVAWNVVTMIQGVVQAIKAFQLANEGATVAQLILNAAMSANPIGIIVTAIAGLVAAITVLWNTNEDFRKFVLEVWEGIKAAILDAILGVLGWMQNMGNSFVELKDSFVFAAKALADGVVSKLNDLKTRAVSSFNGMKTSVSTIVSGMRTAVVNTVTNIKNNAVSIFTGMKASISSTVTGIKTAIVNGFEKAVSYITSLPGKAVGWGRDFVNGLRRGIENAISGLIRSVKGIANKIRGFLHFSRPDFGPLRDYESWMPDFVGGLASGIEANAWRLEDAVERMAGRASVSLEGSSAGGGGYNLGGVSIVVNAAKGQDEEAIANKVMRKMQNLYDSKRRVYR